MGFEDLRETIMTVFKSKHSAAYPTTPVEYPNQDVVDEEHQTDPWVKLELMVENKRQVCLGSTSERVWGLLYVSVNIRRGEGIKWLSEYSDFLNTEFSLKEYSGITFREVHPLPRVSYPSWETLRVSLPFTLEF